MITPQIDRSVGDGLENSNAPFAKDEEEDTKKQDVTSGEPENSNPSLA